jgi:hypothetical protein
MLPFGEPARDLKTKTDHRSRNSRIASQRSGARPRASPRERSIERAADGKHF